ncbi:MAG: MFS transporter, partial [Propionibacteriaceae bacterium]|nr:MFS transporter [Propionibacteriaceae bacterium]
WLSRLATPDQKLVPVALFAAAVIGVGNAMVWPPMSVAATQHLPPQEAGAGSSIYNIVRQIGAVLGAACVTTLMNDRITANMSKTPPPLPPGTTQQVPTDFSNVDLTQLMRTLHLYPPLADWFNGHFSTAMGQSLWLPVGVSILGAIVAIGLSNQAGRMTGTAPAG